MSLFEPLLIRAGPARCEPLSRPVGRPPWRPRSTARGPGLRRYRDSRPAAMRAAGILLRLDLGADLLEGRLDLLGLFLGGAFLDRLRRALDEVLGFLQAETGDRADLLDDLDLLVAGRSQDH